MTRTLFAVSAAIIAGLVVVLVITVTLGEQELHSNESSQEGVTGLPAGEAVQSELPRRELLPIAQGIGVDRLSIAERQEMRLLLEEHILNQKQELWDHQESADVMDVAALREEADLLHRLAYMEASLLALEQDDFYLLPEGEGLKNAEGMTVIDVTFLTVGGERMSFWVALSDERYPNIASTRSYLGDMAELNQAEGVNQFNAKPLEERKKLFEEQEAWQERKRESQEAITASGDGVGSLFIDAAVYALFHSVGAPPLPGHSRADKATYLLYRE